LPRVVTTSRFRDPKGADTVVLLAVACELARIGRFSDKLAVVVLSDSTSQCYLDVASRVEGGSIRRSRPARDDVDAVNTHTQRVGDNRMT
jgi:hypothetical protein